MIHPEVAQKTSDAILKLGIAKDESTSYLAAIMLLANSPLMGEVKEAMDSLKFTFINGLDAMTRSNLAQGETETKTAPQPRSTASATRHVGSDWEADLNPAPAKAEAPPNISTIGTPTKNLIEGCAAEKTAGQTTSPRPAYPAHFPEELCKWLDSLDAEFVSTELKKLLQQFNAKTGKGLFDSPDWTPLPTGASYLDLKPKSVKVLADRITTENAFTAHIRDKHAKFLAERRASTATNQGGTPARHAA